MAEWLVGMANLLPDAASTLRVGLDGEQITVSVGATKVNDVAARRDLLRARHGSLADLDLNDAAQKGEKALTNAIGYAVVRALDRRFPGLKEQVEMVDVAAPATTVRYTGNCRASFEGSMPTPGYLMKGLPRRLPGLDDFHIVGQWVQPGGGPPTGVMTAREALQLVCRRDGVRFQTTTV